MYTQAHSELAAIRPMMALAVTYAAPFSAFVTAGALSGFLGNDSISIAVVLIALILVALVGGVDTDEVVRHRSRSVYICVFSAARAIQMGVVFVLVASLIKSDLSNVTLETFFSGLTFVLYFVPMMVLFSWGATRAAISAPFRTRPCRVAVVAVSEASLDFVESLLSDPFVSADFQGYFEDRHPERLPKSARPIKILGHVNEIGAVLAKSPVQQVFICLPMEASQRIGQVMDQLLDSAASVHYLHDFVAFKPIHESLSWVTGVPVYTVIGRPDGGLSGLAKRLFDIIGATVGLILLSPLLLLTAVAIRLESPGPALFRQMRYGADGRPFSIYKFRSMSQNACASTAVAQATFGDSRVTRIGRFIRKSSIDELPQLINILLGDMSLVGPRPHAVPHNEHYRSLIRGYMLRHKVRPGLTGWAQVHGLRGETETIDKMESRVRFDLDYLRRWSVALDVYIVILTVRQVMRGV